MNGQTDEVPRFGEDRGVPDPLWKRGPDRCAEESAEERYCGLGRTRPGAPW